MIEFFIAKKYMLDRKRQSLVSIIGITIGILVLTVSIGISNGLDKNMIQSVLSISSHILIKNGNGKPIEDYKEKIKKIEQYPEVKGAVPSVPLQGIIKIKNKYSEYVSGIKIEGFDLAAAKKYMNLESKLKSGKILENKNDGILIGSELAAVSSATVGDKITLITPDGKPIEMEVMGIFMTGYFDYDSNVVMINFKTAQYISYLGDKAKDIGVILNNPYKAPEVATKLFQEHRIIGRTWGELNRNLLSALTLEKTVMIIVFSLIVIIAGFVVWVILNMLVREKIKDIGILRAMGFSRKNISRIFLIQGLTLGTIGIVFGVIISLILLWYIKNYSLPGITSIYYIQKIPIEISVKEIGIIVGANFLIILLSSFSPAYRASKLETQEALKYE
ncbi:MAG: FtsX-like permease family protein [Fusobacteriaceae bacterium]